MSVTLEQERAEARKALEQADNWRVWTVIKEHLRNSLDREEHLNLFIGHLKSEQRILEQAYWIKVNKLAERDKEIQRLLKVEEDYKALVQIMDRARKLAFLVEEEPGPRFKMDDNGNLTRIDGT